jgi:hypothetical protein
VPVNEAGARVHVNTRGPERPMTTAPDATEPAVLLLCTHNAGRSQIAMGFFKHLAGNRAAAYSGGSEPAESRQRKICLKCLSMVRIQYLPPQVKWSFRPRGVRQRNS